MVSTRQLSKFAIEIKKYRLLYFSWQHIYCPALNQDVFFTRKGWDHIISKEGRTKQEKLRRIRVLPKAKQLLSITTTIQEMRFQFGYQHYGFVGYMGGEKIKVVIAESNGTYFFWTTFKV